MLGAGLDVSLPDLGLPLPEVAGAQLVGFVIVMARIGPLFVLAPGFSSRVLGARVKVIVALALGVALAPLALKGQRIPDNMIDIALLIVKEAFVGIGLALAVGVISAGVAAGAALADTMIGFSFSSLVDPSSNTSGSMLGQIYGIVAMTVFMVGGGDRYLLLGLDRSYDLLPLAKLPSLASFAALATDGLGEIALIGLAVTAPVIVTLFITDIALAVVSRAVPQMNVLYVGLPGKILLGVSVVAASLPFVGQHIESQIPVEVSRALHALAGG